MYLYMGVSENSVSLNPMVNDHYPYEMAIIGDIPYFQTNPQSRSAARFPPLTLNTSNGVPHGLHLAVQGGHLAEHGGGAAVKARGAQNHQIATLKLRLGRGKWWFNGI